MSVAQSHSIKVGELVDYINGNLKNNIQSKIVWHQGNPPAYFPGAWLSRFQYGTGLSNITEGNIGPNGATIRLGALYSALQSLLLGWSCVRRVRYLYRTGNYSNGGAVTYTTVYDNTQYSLVDWGYRTDIFSATGSYKQAAGSTVVASTITGLISALHNTWNSLGVLTWEYSTCHSNCHGSCHGSGGWR